MKSTSIKTVLLLLVFCVTVSACARKLPKEIVNLLDERFDYTSYQIVSYQKAPHPENYPGFGGSLQAKDEAWCVVVETPDWGYSRSIYFRLGNHWSVGVQYKQFFEQVGCTNYQ